MQAVKLPEKQISHGERDRQKETSCGPVFRSISVGRMRSIRRNCVPYCYRQVGNRPGEAWRPDSAREVVPPVPPASLGGAR